MNSGWRKLVLGAAVWANLLFIITGYTSCVSAETKEQQASARRISQLTDSLSALGEHGYHVAYFLVGRFKTSPIKVPTFDVSVTRMDDRLLERPIKFRVLDALTYQLSYSLDDSETVMIGDFDQDLDTDLFRLLLARPQYADSTSLEWVMENASNYEHELKVFRY